MTNKQKQCLLTFLGYDTGGVDGIWGAKSQNALECCQEDLGLPNDGVWGHLTENAVLEAVYTYDDGPVEEDTTDTNVGNKAGTFWDDIEYFGPEEFACKCGQYHDPYCDGYPHEIQPLLVQIADRARRHFGHPIQVISGLRCEKHNKDSKGVWNSQHMYGEAADVYFYGVSPATALAWLNSQPDVRFAYQIEGSSNIHFDIEPVGR